MTDRPDTATDAIKRAVADELEAHRTAIDNLKRLRTVAIRVKIPAIPGQKRPVLINLETESS